MLARVTQPRKLVVQRQELHLLWGFTNYQPEWLNIYLHPHGFSMTSQTLQRAEIPAFLRSHNPPVLLPVQVCKGRTHPVVFQKYEDSRYYFINIRSADDNTEPDELSLSSDMLKRRLDDTVDVFTLTECEPTEIDVVPILLESLRTLTAYATSRTRRCSGSSPTPMRSTRRRCCASTALTCPTRKNHDC